MNEQALISPRHEDTAQWIGSTIISIRIYKCSSMIKILETYSIFNSFERMTKPSSRSAITTYIRKKFLVNWIWGTEGYFFNDLINNQRLKKKIVKSILICPILRGAEKPISKTWFKITKVKKNYESIFIWNV